MTGPQGAEVGAQLAELYLKGTTTLPAVADEISAADTSLGSVSVSGVMMRDWSLGVGSQGCYAEVDAARTALTARLGELDAELRSIGTNIVKTARDMARVDDETAGAFRQHGGEL